MFDLSFAELALIVIVAVIFIGPKELPVVIRTIAKAMRSVRSLAKELHALFDDVGKESGLKEAADDIRGQTRMIKGDDGKMYESYDVSHMQPLPKAERNHDN